MATSLLVSRCCTAVCRIVRLEKGLLLNPFKGGCTAIPYRHCLSRGVLTTTNLIIATQNWQERHERQQLDFDEIVQGLEQKLSTTGLAKAAEMNKLLDCVETREQLDVAEKLLVKFAASANPVRVSFAVILARACIRVKTPQRARHIFEQKSRFGVYPTRRVYHMLMDVFLRRRNYREVLTTYNLLLADGMEPTWASHYLAFHAHLWRGAEGDLDRALELQGEVTNLKPDKKRHLQQLVIKSCISHGWIEKAFSYMEEYEREYGLGSQDVFALRLRCLTSAGQLREAIELLRTAVNSDTVWPPTQATILLVQSVLSSDNEALKLSLRETVEALSSHPKFQPAITEALDGSTSDLEGTDSRDRATTAEFEEQAGSLKEEFENVEDEKGKEEEEVGRKDEEISQSSAEVERSDDTERKQ